MLISNLTRFRSNNRIHSLGNTGLTGWIHAAIAPLATKLIDNAAYQGEDVRTRVSLMQMIRLLFLWHNIIVTFSDAH